MTRRPRNHVFIVCEGEPGASRPKLASLLAPRWGPRVRIVVDPLTAEGSTLFVLHRTGHGDLVVLAGNSPAPLEEARQRLGHAADAYTIAQVPVVKGPIEASEAPRRQRRFANG